MHKRQQDFLRWGHGLFIHFGPFTFFPNYGRKRFLHEGEITPPEQFQPTGLNTDNWMLKGFGYAILTAKHQDGFCLWPTETDSPSVKTNGFNRDIVAEYCGSCRKSGIRIGLYYSLYDLITGSKNTEIHLKELLSNYGKIDYIFFDGCNYEKHPFNFPEILRIIRELQPDIVISNGLTRTRQIFEGGDVGWIGNEDGIIDDPDYSDIIPCAYVRTRKTLWFYNDENQPVKTPAEIQYIIDNSNGIPLAFNVGPDKTGAIPAGELLALSVITK
jgi:alpha-L-fucosidase